MLGAIFSGCESNVLVQESECSNVFIFCMNQDLFFGYLLCLLLQTLLGLSLISLFLLCTLQIIFLYLFSLSSSFLFLLFPPCYLHILYFFIMIYFTVLFIFFIFFVNHYFKGLFMALIVFLNFVFHNLGT